MKRMFRIFGYLKHHMKYRIIFNPENPNYDGLEVADYDWSYLYQDAKEDIPEDAPDPATPNIGMTVYADSNHGNCLVTRRSTTGIIVVIGKTIIYTYSKRQNTIETSTYGAEFVAARIAIEKILEYRCKARMMGIRMDEPAMLLIDNKSVVINSTMPSSTLKKKHNAIAYHKVREAVAAGFVKVAHISTKVNKADILTKPLGPQDYNNLLNNIMFTHQEKNQTQEKKENP